MNIKHISLSFWFKELEYSPVAKVGELEKNLKNSFMVPFLINESPPFIDIALPRIVSRNAKNDTFINMSLVNFNLDMRFDKDIDDDEVILYINENLQLLYDVLVEIFNVEILFTSIKVELINQDSSLNSLAKKYLLKPDTNLEDLVIKRGLNKDDKYYLNYTLSSSKEISYDIKLPGKVKPNENDMMSRSMLISLSEAKVGRDIESLIFEINDRLSYNNDKDYRVDKDSLRDIIFEFKMILKELKKE